MKKITDYIILRTITANDLERQVLEYIDKGYQPLGGAFYWSCDNGLVKNYLQTMVKYEI